MANVVKLKRGLSLNLAGEAAPKVEQTIISDTVAIVPDNFHGIVPKVIVTLGDKVKVGTAVMYDKNHPEVQFVSPVSGEVIAVERGERRKVMKIVIKNDGKNEVVTFDKASSATEVKQLLLKAGMWQYIKQRPYDVIADPTVEPRDIFVTAFDNAPLAPAYAYELLAGDDNKALAKGLEALAMLTQGKVYVGVSANSNLSLPACVEAVTFKGKFPACHAGVQAHNIKPVNKGETIWTLNALDVVIMGRLLLNGAVDMMRTVAVTGSEVAEPAYVRALPGTPTADILRNQLTEADYARRVISGNVLTGINVSIDGYLSAYHSQISVIPEGNDTHELLGWAMPGFKALSTSPTFLSSWIPFSSKRRPDARLNGGERAIIMSGEYDRVFPMDILPEYLVKAIIAFDIDRMEQLGIYEVAPEDFAACEFVDTSKLPLQDIVRKGLDALRKEMN